MAENFPPANCGDLKCVWALHHPGQHQPDQTSAYRLSPVERLSLTVGADRNLQWFAPGLTYVSATGQQDRLDEMCPPNVRLCIFPSK